MNTQTIELDLSKERLAAARVRVGQGDVKGTTVRALLYDGGAPLDLTGAVVRMVARLPDGEHYWRGECTVSGNVALCAVDEDKLCSVPGFTDEAYLTVTKGGRTASTERFAIEVLRSAVDGQKPAENWDNAIERLVREGDQASGKVSAAVGAANTAAAKADGAASSATSAATSATDAAAKAVGAATSATDASRAATDAAAGATDAAKRAEDAAVAAEAAGGTSLMTAADVDEVCV